MHFHHPDSLCAQLVTSLSDSKAAYQNQHWDTIECKYFQTSHTPAMWILSSYRTKLAKENRRSWSWSSVIPICSLTRPKSALRQTCVNSFAIQTSLIYVDLIIIRNINGQRKQMQRLLHVRLFSKYSLTRPKSTFRQNCVSLFPIQTRCTYVNLGLISNKTGQRKRTQMLLVIRNSHLQFDN